MPPLPFTAASMTHPLLHLREGPVARLRLNRPELHNAFDATLIAALTGALSGLADDDEVRVVVLEGEGASFSAEPLLVQIGYTRFALRRAEAARVRVVPEAA